MRNIKYGIFGILCIVAAGSFVFLKGPEIGKEAWEDLPKEATYDTEPQKPATEPTPQEETSSPVQKEEDSSPKTLLEHLKCEVKSGTGTTADPYKCVSTEEEPRLTITNIGNWTVDFNSDQTEEEVYIYAQNTGGSGTFYYAIVRNPDFTYSNPLFLGDRIIFEEGSVRDNRLYISHTGHGLNDPLCCPTEKRFGQIIYKKNSIFDLVNISAE